MQPVTVTFYTRPGCHLCDEAEKAMLEWSARNGFALDLREVNIDTDDAAHERFWLHIPVAMVGRDEAFRHRFDAEAFGKLLTERSRGDAR